MGEMNRILRPLRVIVCGGRDYHEPQHIFDVLDGIHAQTPIGLLFHGNARGADITAGEWADTTKGVREFKVPAQWAKFGRAAGPKRNEAMLGHSIDLVIAFPGGRGTADMVRRAKRKGVKVMDIAPRSNDTPQHTENE